MDIEENENYSFTDTKEYDNFLLRAYKNATKSPDPSTQNGAILVQSSKYGNEVIGEGWNDFPLGVNTDYWHGEKEDKYARVVHAEVAAILDAARHSCGTIGSTLICPWAACSNCAKHIAAAGVVKLIRHAFSNSGVTTGSHWFEECKLGDEIMLEAGVEISEVAPIPTSIKLRRNGGLWPQDKSIKKKEA